MRPTPAPMTDEEYLLLNELIGTALGISFPEHKREVLEARLRPRLQGLRLPTYLDYYFLLQSGEDAERGRMAELVTNNETYFFREAHQFEALFEQALDDLRPCAATPGALRLLLAGCSSGEEAYTLAIVARQNFVRLVGTALSVDAFDVDASKVAAAQRAEYGNHSFRATTPEQLERYFVPAADRWTVKPFLREGLRFYRGNIVRLDSFAPAIGYDALFCRNVLIYFSEAALHRAVENFAAVLRPGGLLFLGHSESIIGLTPRFETVRLRNLIAYRKVGA
jgi:chemotaxis protein methyltransferase CheR